MFYAIIHGNSPSSGLFLRHEIFVVFEVDLEHRKIIVYCRVVVKNLYLENKIREMFKSEKFAQI